MRFRCSHVFEQITLSEYEALYFDESFNASLCDSVRLQRKVIDRSWRGNVYHRTVQVRPDRELPRPVAKVLGSSYLEYLEILEYELGSYAGKWRTETKIFPDKISCSGSFGFSERNSGIERAISGDVTVKIFGVGALIERLVVADIERSYERAADFTRKTISSGDHQGLVFAPGP